MNDDTIETGSTTPADHSPIDPPKDPPPAAEPEVADEAPLNAGQRLRAFEDEVFGKDVPRINGQIERGHGSMFARLTPEQKIHHVALERLVKTEAKVADASADLAKAEADHAAAMAAVDGSAAE